MAQNWQRPPPLMNRVPHDSAAARVHAGARCVCVPYTAELPSAQMQMPRPRCSPTLSTLAIVTLTAFRRLVAIARLHPASTPRLNVDTFFFGQ